MRFIDLNKLVAEEGKVSHGGTEHILKEPNGYEWASYNNKINDLDEKEVENVIEIKKWMIKTVIPTIAQELLTPTEFMALSVVCQTVFNGGIQELGKKLNPLEKIITIK